MVLSIQSWIRVGKCKCNNGVWCDMHCNILWIYNNRMKHMSSAILKCEIWIWNQNQSMEQRNKKWNNKTCPCHHHHYYNHQQEPLGLRLLNLFTIIIIQNVTICFQRFQHKYVLLIIIRFYACYSSHKRSRIVTDIFTLSTKGNCGVLW